MSLQTVPKQRVNIRAIIYRDGKLLVVQHKMADGSASEYYAAPGGGLDPHESLVDGLKREVMEETGVQAEVGKLLFVQQFYSHREGYTEELEFFFEVTNTQDFLNIDVSSTTHGNEELAFCGFMDPSTILIYPALLQTADLRSYIESPRPTIVLDNFNE